MLVQFSWGQFLLFSFVMSFFWYAAVLLLFFRKELSGFFGGGGVSSKRVEVVSGSYGDDHHQGLGLGGEKEEPHVAAELGVMGESKLPDGMQVIGMGELGFAAGEDDRYEQVGFVPDVIQELKVVFARLESEAGEKREFFAMLEEVKAAYGNIGGHPSVSRINGYIRERLPFVLSAAEWENLWY